MKRVAFVLVLAALVCTAAELSGRYTGTMEKVKGGPAGPNVEQYQLTLKQTGNTLTGAIGPDANWEIQNPKLEGSKLTFETAIAGGQFVIAYDLTVSGDEIIGTMESKKGPPISGKLKFKKQQ